MICDAVVHQGCCSETEAIAAGGLLDLITKEEMEAELVRHLPKLQLKIGNTILFYNTK